MVEIGASTGSLQQAMQAGQQGIARGTERFASASQAMVRDSFDVGAIVESKAARLQISAGVAVVERADETLGQLIDELA